MVRHNAACAQDGYHKLREKIPLTAFYENTENVVLP